MFVFNMYNNYIEISQRQRALVSLFMSPSLVEVDWFCVSVFSLSLHFLSKTSDAVWYAIRKFIEYQIENNHQKRQEACNRSDPKKGNRKEKNRILCVFVVWSVGRSFVRSFGCYCYGSSSDSLNKYINIVWFWSVHLRVPFPSATYLVITNRECIGSMPIYRAINTY